MHTRLGGHEEHTMGDFLHWKRRNASWQTLLPITAPTTHSNGKNEYAGNNISNHSESPKSPRWQSWAHTHTHTYTNTHTYTQTYTHKHTHHAHWQSWPLVTFVMPLCLAQPLVKGISEILPPDMEFVKNFTPSDFQEKNFTPLISPNFNGLVRKNTKNEWKWINLHRWQKFYTAAGTDGTDKFHLWLPHNRKQSIGCFFLLNTHRLSGRWGLPFLIFLL